MNAEISETTRPRHAENSETIRARPEISETIRARLFDLACRFLSFLRAQVCFSNVPRPWRADS